MWWLPLPEGDMSSVHPGRVLLLSGTKESGVLTWQNFLPLSAWSAELCINDISRVVQPLMCGWKKNTVNFLQEKSSSDSFGRASFINTSEGKQRTGSNFRMDSIESLRNSRFGGFLLLDEQKGLILAKCHWAECCQSCRPRPTWRIGRPFNLLPILTPFHLPSNSFSVIPVPSETLLLPPTSRVPQEEAEAPGKRGKAYPFIRKNSLHLWAQ